MSEKQTKNSENPEAKKLPTRMSDMDKLLKAMGIDSSQVDTSKGTRKTKTRTILTNADALKDKSVNAIKEVNNEVGKHIKFTCVVRKGSLKVANGKVKLDEKGDSIPRFEPATKSGFWVIDEIEEDGVKLFEVTRAVQYTESHKIADFSELQ